MTCCREAFIIPDMKSTILTCLCLYLFSLTAPAFAESCSLYDRTYYCDNGTVYSQYGNDIYDNHGHVWSRYAKSTYGTNGRTYSRYGNDVYDRQGKAWSTYGGTTYTPDGDACSRYGNTIYCQKSQRLVPLIAH